MFAKRNFIVNILRRCSHSSGNKVPVDMRIQKYLCNVTNGRRYGWYRR